MGTSGLADLSFHEEGYSQRKALAEPSRLDLRVGMSD